MIQRPWYQAAIGLLTVVALAGAVWQLTAPVDPPGVRVVLPEPSADNAPADAGADADATLIDINAASAQELETLPGIGPVLAGRIIEHREQNGSFQRTDQLTAVRGIGAATYERIRPLVTAGE